MGGDKLKTLYFATSSEIKLKQYSQIFSDFGYEISQGMVINNTLIEPQFDVDSEEGITSLVSHPLRLAARFISKNKQIPYIIEDTMLLIEPLSKGFVLDAGLPGADTKNWWINLGTEGLLELMKNHTNRKAKFICQIGAYLGPGNYLFASASVEGEIMQNAVISEIAEKEFPRSNPYFFHQIFKPLGSNKGMGEMNANEFKRFDYRKKCAEVFVKKLTKIDLPPTEYLKQYDLFTGDK